MKRIFTLLSIILFLVAKTNAQFVTIPDPTFRLMLKTKYPQCFNAAQQMDTTCTAIVNEQTFPGYSFGVPNSTVTNLDGIQYFKSIYYLQFWSAQINYIPSFPQNLRYITLNDNNLSSLPPLPAALVELDVHNNKLTSLPVLPTTLTNLNVNGNLLTNLQPLPASLRTLGCNQNQLTSLPAINYLTYLNCGINKLTSLPSLPPQLYFLACDSNLLTSLPPLPNGLRNLLCGRNQLTQWPAFPASLEYLSVSGNRGATTLFSSLQIPAGLKNFACADNSLTSLPALPDSLESLDCSGNLLSTPPALPDSLNYLYIQSNPLSTIKLPRALYVLNVFNTNITCLPYMPKNLRNLNLDSTKIHCIPNLTYWLGGGEIRIFHGNGYLPQITPKVCNAVNNPNGCLAFPVTQGHVFLDDNNNGIKESNENIKANCRINLSNGHSVYTDNNGFYQAAADTTGSFKLNVVAPQYFKAVPDSVLFNFVSYDTAVTRNIALQRIIFKDSLNIYLTRIDAPRPGFPLRFAINYQNAGSTDLAPCNLTLHYNNTLLTYDSSSIPGVTNSGNSLTLTIPQLLYGSSGNFWSYFKVKATAPLSELFETIATINGGTASSSDTVRAFTSGSFDPNDKTATPVLSVSDVNTGREIDYLIRFQNTGTDTAFHVVITDTLHSKLNESSFRMIASSHPCKTTVAGNRISFEMRNILLPDSNVNEAASHGYLRFKIKPKSNVVLNDVIPNKAAIYFDYNLPVITNTANTQIKNLIAVPLTLISFRGDKTNHQSVLLSWTVQNENNTHLFYVEHSNDGQAFNKIGERSAVGSGDNSYSFDVANLQGRILYFRLKMIDKDGKYTYSPMIVIRDYLSGSGLVINSNPAHDYLSLSNIESDLFGSECKIVSNTGVVVKRFVLSSTSEVISVNNLAAGLYFIGTIKGTEKLIIAR